MSFFSDPFFSSKFDDILLNIFNNLIWLMIIN